MDKRKPNLVFIFTDEQRFDTLHCYGNKKINVPNLNKLAEESIVFENAYVTQPVCTPSRSSIMTGLYPHTNGCITNDIPLKKETRTIAEMVSAEYLCGYYGKWHLGDEVMAQHGFAKWVSIEDCFRHHYTKKDLLPRFSNYYQFLVANGFVPSWELNKALIFDSNMAAELPERFTRASFIGQEATRFITENHDRPFVLFVNFVEPHGPITGPFNDMYPPSVIPVGPQFLKKPHNGANINLMLADYFLNSEGSVVGLTLKTENDWRQLIAQYWGLVTLVDRAVGNILETLTKCGLDDNTIIVFTSDHGDMMGDHGILGKCVMYEEAIKVPLLMRVPWLDHGFRKIQGRFSQINLVPTLLELMNENIPDPLEGTSRVDLLHDEAKRNESDVIVEWNGSACHPAPPFNTSLSEEEINRIRGLPWRTMITADGWKLNLCKGDQCELFNLNTDPYEQENLFNSSKHSDRIRELADRIARWQEQTWDTALMPEF